MGLRYKNVIFCRAVFVGRRNEALQKARKFAPPTFINQKKIGRIHLPISRHLEGEQKQKNKERGGVGTKKTLLH